MRNLFAGLLIALSLGTGCGEREAKFDPVAGATKFAQTYCPAPNKIQGPTCFPESSGDSIPCSYGCTPPNSTESKVTTIDCDIYNHGQCMQGTIPVKTVANSSLGTGGMSNDWLMWYFLLNSGRTTYVYSDWYSRTPASYRSAYYSQGYRPTSSQVSGYREAVKTGGYAAPGASVSKSSYTPSKSTSSTVSNSSSTSSSKSSSSASSGSSSTSRGGFGSTGRSAGSSSS